MSRPTHEQRMRDRAYAEEARAQWEQAVKDGREHGFIQAKWEVYTQLAHAAGAFMDIEHEAALRERASR